MRTAVRRSLGKGAESTSTRGTGSYCRRRPEVEIHGWMIPTLFALSCRPPNYTSVQPHSASRGLSRTCIRGITNSDGVSCYNRCFLNSVVQFLRASPDFVSLVKSWGGFINGERVSYPALNATADNSQQFTSYFFGNLAGVFKVCCTKPRTHWPLHHDTSTQSVERPRSSFG